MFIDSHAHLQWDDYKEDFDSILKNAKEANLEYILNIGTTLETSKESVELAKKYDHIFATVGLHPHDAKDLPSDYIAQLKALAQQPKVIAIGETGLDYFYKHSTPELQRETFENQVKLAKELNLPVSIHCRDAFADCFKIIDAHQPLAGVFHCFTGSQPEAEEGLKRGFYISISGIVTFNKATALQEAVRAIPLDKMLIETDCPYLAPEPFRGKRNEPSYVVHTARKIAELKDVSIEEVGKITTQNTKKLFKLES